MRVQPRRRAPGGGVDLTPLDRLLRPALERAVAVARDDPDAAPPRVRRLLGFSRVKGGAWAHVRHAVDHHDDFRALVADGATAEDVGEAGVLWLTRPEGWAVELDALADVAAAADDDEAEQRDVRRLQRALDGAESARRRADEQAAAADQRADRLAEELAARRAGLTEAEGRATALAAEVERLGAERARAVRSLKQLEAAHRRALDAAASSPSPVPPVEEGPPVVELPAVPIIVEPEVPATPPFDVAAVAADVRSAAQAAAALAAALDAVAGRLGQGAALDGGLRRRGRSGPAPARRARRGPRSRRLPARLPPAVFEDSREATDFLVRLPDVLVLVDGYNVTKTAWPTSPLEDQRERLAVALDELHARTGADPLVVFDGVAAGGPPPGTVPISRATKVRFTDAGVEADDVLLELVDQLPTGRPVVVVSSDRRVQEGARTRGANVLATQQLLDALRR